jgi:hypothetical protein
MEAKFVLHRSETNGFVFHLFPFEEKQKIPFATYYGNKVKKTEWTKKIPKNAKKLAAHISSTFSIRS